ncbi:2-dehydropantoate 2-reductase [Mesobacillus persicus]|uniref:2-dehydropantoate 2-reductase n=1 Tax=Mesobacillus persicus TaxID=930146 RepID=A0A1H8HJX4_9BACI|nr:2-dehydropantoate 2-reductase [Mesobacillus persicus]SEN56500.1 2-dehydropantoate 2-reductase [Mesobacillus persicus]
MNIGIVGTGAVGGYFGACLSKAGHEVTFLARGENLQALKRNDGISIESFEGNFKASGIFTDSYDSLVDVDLILFCVKSTATKEVAAQLVPFLKKEASILTLQNGVDNEEVLAAYFGEERILSAATYIQAQMKKSGVVKQVENPTRLIIGALNSQGDMSRLDEVSQILESAGIETYVSSNILKVKWKKLLWNVTFNPLSALIEGKVGVILDDDGLRRTAERIGMEALEVAKGAGIPLEDGLVSKIIEQSDPARNHETSMLQDKRNGKPMELESICGYVVKKGKELGVETPVLETIYSLLKLEETKRFGR